MNIGYEGALTCLWPAVDCSHVHTCLVFRKCGKVKHINPLSTKLYLYDLMTQLVPRSKHFSSRL